MNFTTIFTKWNFRNTLTIFLLAGIAIGVAQKVLAISRCHAYGIEAYALQEAGRQLGCRGKFFSRTDEDNPYIHRDHCEKYGNVNDDNYERARALLSCIN